MGDLFVARQGFQTVSPKKERVIVYLGDIAEEGHYLLDRSPALFQPLEVKFPAPEKSKPAAVPPLKA